MCHLANEMKSKFGETKFYQKLIKFELKTVLKAYCKPRPRHQSPKQNLSIFKFLQVVKCQVINRL